MKTSSNGNYENEEGEFVADFLAQQKISPELAEPEIPLHPLFSEATCVDELGSAEENSLYYLAGYCVSNITKYDKVCDNCISRVSTSSVSCIDAARLTQFKEYKDGSLTHPAQQAYQVLLACELVFRQQERNSMSQRNVQSFLLNLFE